jgi:hypothetical protein
LGIDCLEFQMSRNSAKPLNVQCMIQLCDQLDLSMVHLLLNEIDYKVLKNRFFDLHPVLPEKYSHNAFGNLATFRSIAYYAGTTGLVSQRNALYTALQIDRRLVEDPLTRVNIQLYEDATQKLNKQGATLKLFKDMGVYAALENLKYLDLSESKKKYVNYEPFARNVFLAFDMLDKNHHYQIEKLTTNHALISARPHEKIQDGFKRKIVGNIYTSVIKQGGFTGIPYFSGDSIRIESKLLKSIHQGDDCCLYELSQH